MHHRTLLLQNEIDDTPFPSLAQPVHRGSTLVFPTVESFLARHNNFYDGYSYGLYGHPASRALAAQIAALEGGSHCVITPSGMSAIMLINLAVLSHGDHVLLPDNVYAPSRDAAGAFLAQLGIEAEFYDPQIGGGIIGQFRPNTRLVWLESPGSFTMEVQDAPAIVAAAHAHGAQVASDGTWASPIGFKALGHGIDYSVQALSKYVSGHSDILMGSVSVGDEAKFRRLKDTSRSLGLGVSPDDCYLTLRGLGTLSIRLERIAASALQICQQLQSVAGVAQVLYPPLATDPGHALWQRDFEGAGGVFSLVLEPSGSENLAAFLEEFKLIRIGASWGGLHTLVAPARLENIRTIRPWTAPGPVVRFSIGLEDTEDLLADIKSGLNRYLTPTWEAAQ